MGIDECSKTSFNGKTGVNDKDPRKTRSVEAYDDVIEKDSISEAMDMELSTEIKIAFAGRPNTGKSSITNRLLGSERMIVSNLPGTTRDAIDSQVAFRNRNLILIDTAGLRRKSRIEAKVEEHSVVSALRTIERADVVNLIIDANEGVSHQMWYCPYDHHTGKDSALW